MPSSTMIHVRIDEKIKKEAAEIPENMGLSVSDAVRVFLNRVNGTSTSRLSPRRPMPLPVAPRPKPTRLSELKESEENCDEGLFVHIT